MEILLVPNEVLRLKAQKLTKITKEDINIAHQMMNTMIKAPGVGLAANQVGILKQIVTINFEDKENNKKANYILFNPSIIEYSEEKTIMEEGCLSLPEQYADVERPKQIIIEYIDENEKLIKKEIDGYEARILQHEIDHLSGKLFVDYLSSLKRNILIKKVKKLQNTKKGRIPSFVNAESQELSKKLYNKFISYLADKGLKVQSGEFGSNMDVKLVNNGPVTFVLDSED